MSAAAGRLAVATAAPRRSRLRHLDALSLTLTLATVSFAIVWAFPLYWGLITTFKPEDEVVQPGLRLWPHHFTFENYTVNDCNTPIFMEVQNRKMPHARIRKGFGSVKDITVKNFTCLHSSRTSQINVEKGGRLENITLENLSIHNFGTFAGTDSPIWLTGKYPDAQRCGEMPAHGLFARCVDNLALKGKIEFFDDGHSNRPATTYEDVTLKP